jgi:hypothetical protein
MGPRLSLDAKVMLAKQTDFSEPLTRHNTEPAAIAGWSDSRAWDDIAAFYREA